MWPGDRRIEIKKSVARWLASGFRYFKITRYDGDFYIIRHEIEFWKCELTFYRSMTSSVADIEKRKCSANKSKHGI
ncbi:MAG: hypothetical protein PHY78_06280 [Desulfobacterales bacterium]|nr:hypothetical protein [Desulfobacterales bacterium]